MISVNLGKRQTNGDAGPDQLDRCEYNGQHSEAPRKIEATSRELISEH